MQLANAGGGKRFNTSTSHRTHPVGLVKEGTAVAAMSSRLDIDLRKIRMKWKSRGSGPDMVTWGSSTDSPAKKSHRNIPSRGAEPNHNYWAPEHLCSAYYASRKASPPRYHESRAKLEERAEEYLTCSDITGFPVKPAAAAAVARAEAPARTHPARANPKPPLSIPSGRDLTTRPPNQTRSGHRPGQRNRTRHPDPQPAHQE